MTNLQPSSFFIPILALSLMIVLYLFLLRRVYAKASFKRFTITILVVAFLLNFLWETLQMPLYKDAEYDLQSISICGLASIADANMVLLLYYVFALIYQDPFYGQKLTFKRGLILVVVGGIGAMLVEKKYTSDGTWAYSDAMPIIPFVEAGLSPDLQFMILPVLIYYLSFKTISASR